MRSLLVFLSGCALGVGAGYMLWGTMIATENLPMLGGGDFPPVSEIEWDDGDSERLRFEGYPFDLDFRLKDWDAAETGDVVITGAYGRDRTARKRHLVNISLNGEDLSSIASASGYLKSWRHENGNEIESRPIWCESDP